MNCDISTVIKLVLTKMCQTYKVPINKMRLLCCNGCCYTFSKLLKTELNKFGIVSNIKVLMRQPDSLGMQLPHHCVLKIGKDFYDSNGLVKIGTNVCVLSLTDKVTSFLIADENNEFWTENFQYSSNDTVKMYVENEFKLTDYKFNYILRDE